MTNPVVEYFKCPEEYARLEPAVSDGAPVGFFRFGPDVICYGAHPRSIQFGSALYDAKVDSTLQGGSVLLPFSPAEVIENLRLEKYMVALAGKGHVLTSTFANLYYAIRPILPVAIRKRIQGMYLKRWHNIPFPSWPVDTTVDDLMRHLLLLCFSSAGAEQIPFIWFWPDGASSCAIITHDVETEAGYNYCEQLIDVDESFGIYSSFQIVPEKRYTVSESCLRRVRSRGFEINIHDLNHDGLLYKDREQFLRRVEKINRYGEQYSALGFRSAIAYRRQEWFDELRFKYDMSVPNVAHLDPQRGGCCTVMPYFVGNLLELPITTTQDYSLFHILNDYSLELWKTQIELILQRNGLVSFIVHPDYIGGECELRVYKALLTHLTELRASKSLWVTTPEAVNSWWRERASMRLRKIPGKWQIEGQGCHRACIAYASVEDGLLQVEITPPRAAIAMGVAP